MDHLSSNEVMGLLFSIELQDGGKILRSEDMDMRHGYVTFKRHF